MPRATLAAISRGNGAGPIRRLALDPVLTDPVLDFGKRRRGGLDDAVDRHDRISRLIGKRDDFGIVVGAHRKAGLQRRLEFGREADRPHRCAHAPPLLIGGVVVTGSLAAATASAKLAPSIDLVLDLGHQVGQRFLALVGGQQRGDLVAGLGQASARSAANVVDLDDMPAEVGADRPDDRALGGGEGRVGDGLTGERRRIGRGSAGRR